MTTYCTYTFPSTWKYCWLSQREVFCTPFPNNSVLKRCCNIGVETCESPQSKDSTQGCVDELKTVKRMMSEMASSSRNSHQHQQFHFLLFRFLWRCKNTKHSWQLNSWRTAQISMWVLTVIKRLQCTVCPLGFCAVSGNTDHKIMNTNSGYVACEQFECIRYTKCLSLHTEIYLIPNSVMSNGKYSSMKPFSNTRQAPNQPWNVRGVKQGIHFN